MCFFVLLPTGLAAADYGASLTMVDSYGSIPIQVCPQDVCVPAWLPGCLHTSSPPCLSHAKMHSVTLPVACCYCVKQARISYALTAHLQKVALHHMMRSTSVLHDAAAC